MLTERIKFRLYVMPCCSHMLCWVNPRHPSFCPNCGKHIYPDVKGAIVFADDDAILQHREDTSLGIQS